MRRPGGNLTGWIRGLATRRAGSGMLLRREFGFSSPACQSFVARLRDDQRQDDLGRPDHLARDGDVVGRIDLVRLGPVEAADRGDAREILGGLLGAAVELWLKTRITTAAIPCNERARRSQQLIAPSDGLRYRCSCGRSQADRAVARCDMIRR